jgi:hypothetical protein
MVAPVVAYPSWMALWPWLPVLDGAQVGQHRLG